MNEMLAKKVRDQVGKPLFSKVYGRFSQRLLNFPASIKHHHAEQGGYLRHISEVIYFCEYLMNDQYPIDTIMMIKLAFIHDLDKLERYKIDTEPPTTKQLNYARGLDIFIEENECKNSLSTKIDNKKNGLNNPIQRYGYVDKLVADESAMVVQICMDLGIPLIHEEVHALCCHHGGWSAAAQKGQMSPMATILHCADLMSTNLMGNKNVD